MGMEPEINAVTTRSASSLPQPEHDKHRAWIGVRVEALLDGYWQTNPPAPVKALILADWMAALEDCTQDEITAACREWLRDEPRVKPKPGDIAKLIRDERGRKWVRENPRLPKPEPVTFLAPDEWDRRRKVAAELLAQAGYARRMGDGASGV
jgi:hypothetical protein